MKEEIKNEIKVALQKIENKLNINLLDPDIIGKDNYEKKGYNKDEDYNIPLNKIYDTLDIQDNRLKNLTKYLQDSEDNFDRDRRYDRYEKAMQHPEVAGVLNIYADEANCTDSKDRVLHVYHEDKKVADIVEDCFARIGLEDPQNSWQITRDMCGYGDEFREIIFSKNSKRILGVNHIPRKLIARVEENSVLKYFKPRTPLNQEEEMKKQNISYYWNNNAKEKDIEIDPFRVLHFKIPSSKYNPYGESIADSVINNIERLNLLEQAMVVARVTRAPERRIYDINVGFAQGETAKRLANSIIEGAKRRKTLDLTRENRLERVEDFFSSVEDIVIPRRQGEEPSKVDTLPQLTSFDISDVEFHRDRIFPGLGVPRQYLYDDQFTNANANLANKSIRFAKAIKRIQKFLLYPYYKLAAIELALRGYKQDVIDKIIITMNNPSNIDERERIDIQTSRWGLISTIKSINTENVFYPDYLIYKDVLSLNNEEILLLMKLSAIQKKNKNPFYVVPGEDKPGGYTELDELLDEKSSKLNYGTEDTQDELEGDIDMGGGDASGNMDAGTAPDMGGGEIPAEVGDAMAGLGGETNPEPPGGNTAAPPAGGAEVQTSSYEPSIFGDILYNENKTELKKVLKAIDIKKRFMNKKKELANKLYDQNIISKEDIDILNEEELIEKLITYIPNDIEKETKYKVSVSFLEAKGDLDLKKFKEKIDNKENNYLFKD